MRVLVLGARGLLGSSLVPHLEELGHEVMAHARSGTEVYGDLTDRAQATRVLEATLPHVVVNLVAATNVDSCERDPHAAYLSNVRVVENLVSWLRIPGHSCHLIHLSTDQIYDGNGPHSESDVHLVNYYGFSKYAGELAAAQVDSTILRTNFFGRSRCRGRYSLSDWVVDALREGRSITVFEDVWFSPLSIGTLCELVELAVRQRICGTFNVGSSDGMSKADFAFSLAEALSLPTEFLRRGSVKDVRLPAPRPLDMRMNPARFEEAFALNMPTMMQEIMTASAAYAG